jgi:hypothetical protein
MCITTCNPSCFLCVLPPATLHAFLIVALHNVFLSSILPMTFLFAHLFIFCFLFCYFLLLYLLVFYAISNYYLFSLIGLLLSPHLFSSYSSFTSALLFYSLVCYLLTTFHYSKFYIVSTIVILFYTLFANHFSLFISFTSALLFYSLVCWLYYYFYTSLYLHYIFTFLPCLSIFSQC